MEGRLVDRRATTKIRKSIGRVELTVEPSEAEERQPTIENGNDEKIDVKSFAFFQSESKFVESFE